MKHEPSQSIPRAWLITEKFRGFSLVEVLLSGAVFSLLVTALVGVYLYGEESTALAGNRARAVFFAEEGLEAVRNIRDANFTNLSNGTYGLAVSGGQWNFSGSSDTNGIFTREVVISSAGMNRKDVEVTVSWQQNASRIGQVSLTSRFTHWQEGSAASSSCTEFVIPLGYSQGTCRQNTVQCGHNGETHEAGGDVLCIGGPSADTCCALP
ncbi:MAG: hypothetical protein IPK84_04170 [Candidatus Moraniibacteriota bacterium]|nr:MAG: hypothetical protein IPK84_04170 [Candidatus Moranbacteria bacterium]